MGFKAFPVQERLFEAVQSGDKRIVGFGGGIRGTKTWGMLALVITLCRLFPRSRWAVVRKDLPTLRRNTIPSFNKLRPEFGGFVGEINQSDWTATCTNGSQIIFFSESIDIDPDLSRWKGLEVNGFVLEEADELQERSYIKALERAGAWIVPNGQQPPPYVFCTFNPCSNWPKKIFYEPWLNGTIAAPYAFIPATAADNPAVPQAQREAWKQMPAHEYKRFVEGDWTVLSGRFYDGLNAAIHIIKRETLPDPLPMWWEYWGAYDWGYAHWAPFGSFCKDPNGRIILLDTTWMRREQDEEMAATILATTAHPLCLNEVYAGWDCWSKPSAHGAAGTSTADVFYSRGINLAKADTDRINGGRALRRALAPTLSPATNGHAGFVMVDTPGNRRVFDQLADAMPDPNNIDKPLKVDADAEGRGGDDGADMSRYGVATKYRPAIEPPTIFTPGPNQDPNRWQDYVGVGETAGQGFDSQLPRGW